MVRKKQDREMEQILLQVLSHTADQMKEMSFSYEKLGKILKDVPAVRWSLQEDEIEEIRGRLSMKSCGGCEKIYDCYKSGRDAFCQELRDVLFYIEKNGAGGKLKLPEDFFNECPKREYVFEILVQSYELILMRKIWRNKMFHQRMRMASQMEETGKFLFDASLLFDWEKKRETKLERKLEQKLRKEKLRISFLRIYETSNKKKEVFLFVRRRKGCLAAERICRIVSSITGVAMIPDKNCKLLVSQENVWIHLREDVHYQLLFGTAFQKKEGEMVSGDLYSMLKLEEGKQICILADGMGSGEDARNESCRMLELLEQLLKTGFREEEAVRLVHDTLTFGVERERYSSVDLFSVQLHTGLLKIIKSAGAPSFLIRENQADIICSKNLPAGLLWETEFDVLYKKLYDGDKVVLVSDGILEGIPAERPEEELKAFLLQLTGKNPQQAAEEILSWSLEKHQGKAADDMSVIVLSVWRKKNLL